MTKLCICIGLCALVLGLTTKAETVVADQAVMAPGLNVYLPDQNNQLTSLHDMQGKVLLVDFWASWCGPCRQSFPWMNSMQRKYRSKGLQVVGVNVDEKTLQAQDFLSQVPANFTLLFDSRGKLPAAFSLPGMPSSYLIDRQGRMRAQHVGFHPSRTADYEAAVVELLKER